MDMEPKSDSELPDVDLEFLSFQDSALDTSESSLFVQTFDSGRPTNKRQRPRSRRERSTEGSGRWTKEEDAVLKSLVQGLEPDWDQVTSHFPNRHKSEVQRRWENSFDPRIKKAPWTPEEDQQILTLLERFGSVWKRIAKHMDGRPPDHIKNRYYGHLKATHSIHREKSENELDKTWENPDIYLASRTEEGREKKQMSASAAALLAKLKSSVAQLENDLKEARLRVSALDSEMNGRKTKS